MGDWKAVFGTTNVSWIFPFSDTTVKWRLFNLAEDPGETLDLAAEEPERLSTMVQAWKAYADRVGVFVPEPLREQHARPH